MIRIATAIIVALICSTATAAVRPINPDLSIGTQTAKDAQQQRPACVEPHVYVLALRLPDGRRIAVKTIVVLKPC